MAVRLKLKVNVKGKVVEMVALLNSGYEAPSPQLLIPVDVAKKLDLWPPEGALDVEFDTAGGLLKAWLYPKAGRTAVVANDERSKEVGYRCSYIPYSR